MAPTLPPVVPPSPKSQEEVLRPGARWRSGSSSSALGRHDRVNPTVSAGMAIVASNSGNGWRSRSATAQFSMSKKDSMHAMRRIRVPRPLSVKLPRPVEIILSRLHWRPQYNPRVPPQSGMLARLEQLRQAALRNYHSLTAGREHLRDLRRGFGEGDAQPPPLLPALPPPPMLLPPTPLPLESSPGRIMPPTPSSLAPEMSLSGMDVRWKTSTINEDQVTLGRRTPTSGRSQ